MSVLILGGDGYLGWPLAMHFSAKGEDVTVVDNYFRRNEATQLSTGMLYPVPTLPERARIWYEKTGYEIKVIIGDLSDPRLLEDIFLSRANFNFEVHKGTFTTPQTVIHLAEQPSAPYSLMDCAKAGFTITNNLLITNNLMFALKNHSPETHMIHVGTMGEYGTPNIDIEEGWLEITHKNRSGKFLFPRQASSIYHTSKIMDTDLLWFGVRTWGLKVTDLMQGPVYGIETDETLIDARLRPFFNYDEIFGTVLNRFVTQAVADYPLTIYGKGGQTRGYLNIQDTLQCVYLAFKKPAEKGELRIFNQIMETFSVNQLAQIVVESGKRNGLNVILQTLENPRTEAEEHYYNPTYQGLLELGVVPHYLTEKTIDRLLKIVMSYKENIRKDVMFRNIKW